MDSITIDQVASVAMHLILTKQVTQREALFAQRIFSENASIVLIPRGRPVLAVSVRLSELLGQGFRLPLASETWVESWRTLEQDSSDHERTRVSCCVKIGMTNSVAEARVDFLFIADNKSLQIRSCCVVYDEPDYAVPSPVTLKMSAITDDVLRAKTGTTSK